MPYVLGTAIAFGAVGWLILRQYIFEPVRDITLVVVLLGAGGGLILSLLIFGILRRTFRDQEAMQRQVAVQARTLEERIAARTGELSAATQELSGIYQRAKASKDYLANLIENSTDAIVTLDPRGRLTFVSPGGQRMFGVGDEDVVGTSIRSRWSRGRTDFRAFRRQLTTKGRVLNHETELRAADGGSRCVNVSASLLYGTDGQVTGVVAVVKDLSEHRQLQEQAMRAERLAAAGLLAAGVAHEIGNPLTCISTLSQMLAARSGEPMVRRGLEDIQVHTERIERIVQDLSQVARPPSLRKRKCAVEDIVLQAVRLARHHPAVRSMRIDIQAIDQPLPPLWAAPDQLLQVFLNLVLNAADAGGGLTVTFAGSERDVRVVFTDTGCGMSDEQLRRLFDPFASTKDATRHLGLGLFVSQEIVRQHAGMIVAESRAGLESSFTVVLPVAPPTGEGRP